MKRQLFVMMAIAVSAGAAIAAGGGVRQKQPKPYDYGSVTIANHAPAAGMAPVRFDHWVHRSRFTCRLCHVDIGFAMKGGGSDIRAADNARGYFCGSCHDGRFMMDGHPLFASCDPALVGKSEPRCQKCHRTEPDPGHADRFITFASRLPRERLGNGINWERAEEKGFLTLQDTLPGISLPRPKMAVQRDFSLNPAVKGLPDIIFSHRKHTVWNGCEVCHPDIFAGVKKGATKYSMLDINEGKYCGTCHRSVAFPLQDCQRCHVKETS